MNNQSKHIVVKWRNVAWEILVTNDSGKGTKPLAEPMLTRYMYELQDAQNYISIKWYANDFPYENTSVCWMSADMYFC